MLKYTQSVARTEDVNETMICQRLDVIVSISGVPRNFIPGRGGVQQIQLRTEDRENGDLGAVAP